MKAFIKYTKLGKIIPGSLVVKPNGVPPTDGIYKEVPVDLCCPICPKLICTKYRNDNPGIESIEGVECAANSSGDHEVNPGETICMQTVLGTSAPFTQLGDCGCDKS